MAHRKQHRVGKPFVSSNCGVNVVRHAFTLLCLAVVLSSGFVSVSDAALPVGSAAPTCVGDCNNSGAVTVDEIVLGVGIALGTQSLDQCRRFDCNGTGQVTIDCIISAVSAALNGCQSTPTDTPAPTLTPTLTATPTRTPTATNTPATTPTTATAACGTFLGKFGRQGSGDGQFLDPEAVAVDQSGNVFVADTGNHRIEKFTSTGTFLRQWGSMGSADGQFHSPEGIAVDGAGNVFVTDLNNNRIEKFDNDGTFLTTWGDAGNGDGQFSGPVGVAVDATGNVFVADRFNNRIQKFTNTGTFLTKWGTVGNGDGQFGNPVGVAVDRNLNVFVADFFNDRIQKFTDTGTFLTKWGSTGSGNAQFIGARAVAVDGSANVFAVDDGNERIEVFTDTGTFLTTWGSPGTHDGQFNSATAVAVGANGEILVLDESNRVQRFTCSPTIDEAALAASTRVATDPIFRLFDLQASLGASASVAGRSRAASGRSAGVSGCQQLDCSLFGTHEDCCSATQFSQFFSNCAFDDDLGRVVTLNGLFVLDSDTADVCTGAIPVGASFDASLSTFTQDVMFPDHSFSHTFQELSETFELTPGGCTASQPDPFGFGVRGDGRRFIDGELQQFQGDGFGNILVDTASEVHGLEIAAGSTQEPDGCAVDAALNGSMTNADVRVGTQFKTDFTDFHVAQLARAGALFLGLNGTVGTDCLGNVTLSTIEPLRIASADPCFTAGRLEAQLADGTVSVTYAARGGSDLDFGADGNVDQHFATCTDVPADQCSTTVVGLCGACTALNQCQTGLGCFPCSRDCSGNTSRCGLPDTFVTCEDGVF
jgi:hypothetical protein